MLKRIVFVTLKFRVEIFSKESIKEYCIMDTENVSDILESSMLQIIIIWNII